MKLYVTRHGQTAWNRENIVCGVTDLPLDETGMEQAREIRPKAEGHPHRPGHCFAPAAGPADRRPHL